MDEILAQDTNEAEEASRMAFGGIQDTAQNNQPLISAEQAKPQRKYGPDRIQFNLDTIYELASLGLTMEQIARGCHVAPETLARRMKDTPEIAQAFNQGRLSGQIEAVTEIKKQAPKNPIIALFRTKHLVGWHDKPREIEGGMKVEVTIKLPDLAEAKSRIVPGVIEATFSDVEDED